jgi:hypothetical protein
MPAEEVEDRDGDSQHSSEKIETQVSSLPCYVPKFALLTYCSLNLITLFQYPDTESGPSVVTPQAVLETGHGLRQGSCLPVLLEVQET